jgi:hypothetical protein
VPQTQESKQARELTAYTLEFITDDGPDFLTLPIAPQSTSMSEPFRSGAQETLTSHYIEEWGGGFKPITLDGHTGFSVKRAVDGGEPLDGYQAFKRLVGYMRRHAQIAHDNAVNPEGKHKKAQIVLHMWEEDEHWFVIPNGQEALRRSRNSNAPLLFNYTLSLLAYKQHDDVADQLGTRYMLMNPPDPDGLLKNMDDGVGLLGDLSKTGTGQAFIGVANLLATGALNLIAMVKAVQKGIRDVVSGVVKSFKGMVAAAQRAAKACRDLINVVRGAIQGVANVIRWSRGLVNLWCSLKHAGKWFRNITSPITTEWQALKRDMRRC